MLVCIIIIYEPGVQNPTRRHPTPSIVVPVPYRYPHADVFSTHRSCVCSLSSLLFSLLSAHGILTPYPRSACTYIHGGDGTTGNVVNQVKPDRRRHAYDRDGTPNSHIGCQTNTTDYPKGKRPRHFNNNIVHAHGASVGLCRQRWEYIYFFFLFSVIIIFFFPFLRLITKLRQPMLRRCATESKRRVCVCV